MQTKLKKQNEKLRQQQQQQNHNGHVPPPSAAVQQQPLSLPLARSEYSQSLNPSMFPQSSTPLTGTESGLFLHVLQIA
jgi:hypothetical protein